MQQSTVHNRTQGKDGDMRRLGQVKRRWKVVDWSARITKPIPAQFKVYQADIDRQEKYISSEVHGLPISCDNFSTCMLFLLTTNYDRQP